MENSGIPQFLPPIHQRLCTACMTPAQVNMEGSRMAMGARGTRSIWCFTRMSNCRTSTSSRKTWWPIWAWSRCIRIRGGCSTPSAERGQQKAPYMSWYGHFGLWDLYHHSMSSYLNVPMCSLCSHSVCVPPPVALSMITHCLTCFNCVYLCLDLCSQLWHRLSI